MISRFPNRRLPEVDVDSMFPDRWSPRAFLDEAIPKHHIKSFFEAARWAPSCYNEQPWLFIYASKREDRRRFVTALMAKNRLWADRAPVLIFLFTRRLFSATGKPNRHASFDAGAAWMALALQARKLGLYAHAMAGFSRKAAFEVTGVPEEEYEAMVAIAVGRHGDSSILPDDLAAMEFPNERKPLVRVAYESRFHSEEHAS